VGARGAWQNGHPLGKLDELEKKEKEICYSFSLLFEESHKISGKRLPITRDLGMVKEPGKNI